MLQDGGVGEELLSSDVDGHKLMKYRVNTDKSTFDSKAISRYNFGGVLIPVDDTLPPHSGHDKCQGNYIDLSD